MIISGDQSIFWDAPLKLALLAELAPGRRVRHMVHTADLFSRHGNIRTAKETKQGPLIASPEVYNPDGNINRWSATCEGALFLGRMPLHPKELLSRGVDFARIANLLEVPIERVVHELTRGDWFGLSYPDQRRAIAHRVPMKDLLPGIGYLRKTLRTNLSETLSGIPDANLAEFDRLFSVIEPIHDVDTWGEASVLALERTLRHLKVPDTIGVSTTFGNLSSTEPPRLLTLFVNRYDEFRRLYNETIESDDYETILALEDGQLPFAAIVDDDGSLERIDLHRVPGDSVHAVLKRAARSGKLVGVIGKAIPNLIEMLLGVDLVLMEKGSGYAGQALAFAKKIAHHFGDRKPHRLLRLRVHALDALADVEGTLLLPPYLREAFGGERILARDIANSWRAVRDASIERANALTGDDPETLLRVLSERGKIGPKGVSLIRELFVYQRAYDNAQRAIKGVPAESSGKKREKLSPETLARLDEERARFNPEIQRTLIRTAVANIDHERAKLLANELKIAEALEYWDCRPYSAWILSVPGWYDAVRRRAELVEEGVASADVRSNVA